MFDPDGFESLEAFRKASVEEGFAKGWTPISAEFPISWVPKKLSEIGKQIVSRFLERR